MALFTAVQAGPMDDGATFGNTSPGTIGVDYPDTTDSVDVAGYALTQGALTQVDSIVDNTGGGKLTIDNTFTVTSSISIYITGANSVALSGISGGTLYLDTGFTGTLDLNGNAVTQSGGAISMTALNDTTGGGSLTVTDDFNGGTITDAKLLVNSDLTGKTISGTISFSVSGYAIEIQGQGTMEDYNGSMTLSGSATGGITNGNVLLNMSGSISNGVTGAYGIYQSSGSIYNISGSIQETSSGYCVYLNGGNFYDATGTFTVDNGYGIANNFANIYDFSGTINVTGSGYGLYADGGTSGFAGTINNSGSGYGVYAPYGAMLIISSTINNSGLGYGLYTSTLTNYSGEMNVSDGYGFYNNYTGGQNSISCDLDNTGDDYGFYNVSGGSLMLTGNSTNSSTGTGVYNLGTLNVGGDFINSGGGYGINNQASCNLTLSGTFTHLGTSYGVNNEGATDITGGTFTNNSSTYGIYNNGGSSFIINGSTGTIINGSTGVGIYNNGGTVILAGTAHMNTGSGTFLHLYGGTLTDLSGYLVTTGGVGIYMENSPTITNITGTIRREGGIPISGTGTITDMQGVIANTMAVSNLSNINIKEGITILGVTGIIPPTNEVVLNQFENDVDDATAHASQIKQGTETRYVIVSGYNNYPYSNVNYSKDGTTWIRCPIFTDDREFKNIIWDGTKFCAVGVVKDNKIFGTSTDGINWTYSIEVSGWGTGNNVNVIAHNGSQYIAGGSGDKRILYSSDGVTWNKSNGLTGNTNPYAAAWNGTRWVVGDDAGYIHHSTDGITWTRITPRVTTSYILSIIWDGSKFVGTGQAGTNTLFYSSDGLTWTVLGTTIFSDYAKGIAYNGSNKYVAIGNGSSNTLAYSSDGINWTGLGKTVVTTYGNSVIWDGTKFIAFAYGNQFYTSTDGENWSSASTTQIISSSQNNVAIGTAVPIGVLGVAGEEVAGGGETSHTFS